MPAYRIVYRRNETRGPETIIASFSDLDQAMSVFAARGLSIIYICENGAQSKALGKVVSAAQARQGKPARAGSSFPLRRYSARAMV